MTVNELAEQLKSNDRFGEFLDDLSDRDYPQPGPKGYMECNDQFTYFWRRIAGGFDGALFDYVK